MNRLLPCLSIVVIVFGLAQEPRATSVPPEDAAALKEKKIVDPETARIASVVKEVYAVISGPAGKERDWKKMKSLMHADARLAPIGPRRDGTIAPTLLSVDDYAQRATPIFRERGFFETELAHKIERFGSLAHVFSTYESRFSEDDEKPFQRGINSIQLFHDGTTWKVLQIAWVPETAATPIPARYLR